MNFKIRLADIADTPALTSIFNSDTNIFGEDSTGFGENDIEEYILDKKKKVFVAEHEGQIIGALMADYHETYSHLETLIVEKTFHAKGIGSTLMDHSEENLEGLGNSTNRETRLFSFLKDNRPSGSLWIKNQLVSLDK